MDIKQLKLLRKELHRNPELSGQEVETAGRIKEFISRDHGAQFIENIGGTGLAVVYTFSESGPVIIIRCELDALLIEEENNFAHRSLRAGVSHKCGHDGHMAMLAGLSLWLNTQRFERGRVVLLFQPAEETGTGASGVLSDPRFDDLKPDYLFALHNIPGFPLHGIVILKGSFSSTVQSVAVRLGGREVHSAQPEQGANPALCMAEIIQRLDILNHNDPSGADFRLVVPIYSSMGKKSYGISAGFGELHYTLRTQGIEEMEKLKKEVEEVFTESCSKHQLTHTTEWFDYFPAVVNDGFCNQVIADAAKMNNFEIIHKVDPFRFGEDFGWFTENYKASMFCIGAGLQTSGLHQADYDFPEEILETGINMFQEIIKKLVTIQAPI